MGRLMARLGLRFQKPVQRAYEQSGELVKTWLKTEFPKIQKQAKREGAEICFEDKSGIRSDAQSEKPGVGLVKPQLSSEQGAAIKLVGIPGRFQNFFDNTCPFFCANPAVFGIRDALGIGPTLRLFQ